MSTALIQDVTEFVLDGTHGSPERTKIGVPVLSAQNIKDGKLNYETERYTSPVEYDSFKKRVPLIGGDVLLTIVGTIGRAAVVEEVRPLVLQRSVAILRPKKELLFPRFLYHVSQSQAFKAQLAQSSNQSSQAGVYLGKLKQLRIPLPSLPEQRRIAEILDKAHILRAKRRASLAKLDVLAQSIFLDIFGDPATNPKRWPVCELDELAVKITDGEHLNPEFSPSGMPIVMAGDVLDDEVALQSAKRVEWDLGEKFRRKCAPEAGDLLLVSRGATIGRQCVVCTADPFCLMGSVILIKPHPEKVHAWFLNSYLKHPVVQSTLYKTSGSSAQQAIYLKDLRRLRCFLPPIEDQLDFARSIAAISAVKATSLMSYAELNALFASLQHRAFRDELPSPKSSPLAAE